ncbi:MAG: hypothetical protein U1E17_07445 [Geminicoccaceae bacterium]
MTACKRSLAASGCIAALAVGAAGAADAATLYTSGITAPSGAVWVPDSGLSGGGRLWIADHVQGFCRLDPVGNAATINVTSCVVIGAVGEPAYDSAHSMVYLPDLSSKSVGVTRILYQTNTHRFTGSRTSFNPNLPSPDKKAKTGQLGGLRPDAVAVDANGSIYIGNRKNGAIYRMTAAYTSKPGALEQVANTSDNRGVLGMTFAGNDLYIAEGAAVTSITDPSGITDQNDLCTSSLICSASDLGLGFFAPQGGIAYAAPNLYVGQIASVDVLNLSNFEQASMPGFQVVSAVGYKPGSGVPGSEQVFIGDDPTAGAAVAQGHIWTAPGADLSNPPAP